ncbi:hypothetical protein H5J24_09870 [Chryseobacterium capnotolerans]|uniref:hypothetical protein n=1 Tax=Chryseobacterium TaxID=59732 RepID=UPI00083AD0BF|nr:MULTISPECIES: hypothetical protein [Chryseobacterium]UHO40258.1 hypothetical protein H5J24_09870 [Chryseobacterium capnotolerans]
MKKLIILAASAAIVFTLNSCTSERDEDVTPKNDANFSKQGLKIESSTSKITPPIQGDNPDETIDPTKPDRPR